MLGESEIVIPEELAELFEAGVAVWMATRDAQLVPELARVMGLRVADDRRRATLFVPDEPAGRTFANLRDNGQIAVTFGDPRDYRSGQLKGQMLELRPASDEERAWQSRYRDALLARMSMKGVNRGPIVRLRLWPSRAVEMRVHEVYVQTPGAGAGRPWP